MQALGLIETYGLVVAIESADAMLKAADVTLLEKTLVGAGLVSIAVTGEVAAVKAAVDAGAAAVRQINAGSLMSQHVIPRPHEELDDVMVSVTPLKNLEVKIEEPAPVKAIEIPAPVETVADATPEETVEETVAEELPTTEAKEDTEDLTKEIVDKLVSEKGLEETLEVLNKLKVIKLRNLARDYKEFGITGRLVSKADKKMLITEFRTYYGKNK